MKQSYVILIILYKQISTRVMCDSTNNKLMCINPSPISSTNYHNAVKFYNDIFSILGIFVTISSIGQLISVISISYLNAHLHFFLRFFIGITMVKIRFSIDVMCDFTIFTN